MHFSYLIELPIATNFDLESGRKCRTWSVWITQPKKGHPSRSEGCTTRVSYSPHGYTLQLLWRQHWPAPAVCYHSAISEPVTDVKHNNFLMVPFWTSWLAVHATSDFFLLVFENCRKIFARWKLLLDKSWFIWFTHFWQICRRKYFQIPAEIGKEKKSQGRFFCLVIYIP